MKGMSAALVLATFMAAGLWAAETENPYRKAKVGDWVSYSMTTTMGSKKQTGTMKQTVKAKTEKEVTLVVETVVMDQPVTRESTIDLDAPYDPATTGAKQNAEIEKVAQGKETITVDGKQYDCKWYQTKVTMKQPTGNVPGVNKSWICSDVPLSGLVKSESSMDLKVGGQDIKVIVSLELKDSGKGP